MVLLHHPKTSLVQRFNTPKIKAMEQHKSLGIGISYTTMNGNTLPTLQWCTGMINTTSIAFGMLHTTHTKYNWGHVIYLEVDLTLIHGGENGEITH